MKTILKEKLDIFVRRVLEAGTSCLIFMTSGNVIGLTSKHFMNAGKTGAITGLMAVFLSIFAKKEYKDNKSVVAGAVGFLTAITDLFIHPTHFGGPQTEAIVTGIGAGLLCLALSYIKSDNK